MREGGEKIFSQSCSLRSRRPSGSPDLSSKSPSCLRSLRARAARLLPDYESVVEASCLRLFSHGSGRASSSSLLRAWRSPVTARCDRRPSQRVSCAFDRALVQPTIRDAVHEARCSRSFKTVWGRILRSDVRAANDAFHRELALTLTNVEALSTALEALNSLVRSARASHHRGATGRPLASGRCRGNDRRLGLLAAPGFGRDPLRARLAEAAGVVRLVVPPHRPKDPG